MARIVIATLFKLAAIDGKYSKEQKILERDNAKVPEDYANQVTENYLQTGLIYEIDEKATEQWNKRRSEKSQQVEKLKSLKELANANILGSALAEVVEKQVKKGRKLRE